MRYSFSLLIVVILLPISMFSQSRLTLADAIALAIKNSYDISIAKDNLEIAAVNNYIGVAGGLPLVTGALNDNQTVTSINQKFPDASRNVKRSGVTSNTLTGNVTGGILLFNGYRVKATKKRLEELQGLNQELLNVQIQNTMAAVITSYYDVVRQQNFLSTIKNRKKFLNKE